MAVYFAPQRQQPWWAGMLTQLATGQIDAMMERTKEAKVVEAQRGLAGMVSQLQKENPGMSGSDIMAHVMGDKNYARSGDMGNKLLQTAMTEADRRSAEAELAGLGGEAAGMLKPLILGKKMGLDAKTVSDLLNPTLVQRNSNLGNRYLGQMVNPRTGQVVGDSLDAPIGIDQGTLAKLAQDDKHTMAKLAFDRAKEKRIADEGRKPEDPYKNGRWVQDKNGEWVHVTPSGKKASTGVIGQLTEPRQYADPNSLNVKDRIKYLLELRKTFVHPMDPDANAKEIKGIDDELKILWSTPPVPQIGGSPSGESAMEEEIRRVMEMTGESRDKVISYINARAGGR